MLAYLMRRMHEEVPMQGVYVVDEKKHVGHIFT
jgi:hypothetical protein